MTLQIAMQRIQWVTAQYSLVSKVSETIGTEHLYAECAKAFCRPDFVYPPVTGDFVRGLVIRILIGGKQGR